MDETRTRLNLKNATRSNGITIKIINTEVSATESYLVQIVNGYFVRFH